MSIEICRILIGTDACGDAVVLATDSSGVMWDVEEISNSARELEIHRTDRLTPGLYLWSGTRERLDYDYLYDVYYRGDLRPVEAKEIEELYKMKPPEPVFGKMV